MLIDADKVIRQLEEQLYTKEDMDDGYNADDKIWCDGFNKGINRALRIVKRQNPEKNVVQNAETILNIKHVETLS